MVRWLAVFFFGAFIGAGFGGALGILMFSYLFPPPAAVEHLTQSEKQDKIAAQGSFIHADPSDPIHRGQGKVTLYERTLFLHEDFEVGPGPKFHVYLVPKENIRTSSDLGDTMYVDLGRLRSFKGSQKFPIPPGLDLSRFKSVVIWCEVFNVLISPADLKPDFSS